MPRRTRKPYTGILQEPLPPLPVDGTPEEKREWHLSSVLECWKRRQALLRHYGLDETATDFQLMMALAKDWVPGFRVSSKGQRRKPFNGASVRDIRILAELGKAWANGQTVSVALRRLHNNCAPRASPSRSAP
jgi:hypothetical protein